MSTKNIIFCKNCYCSSARPRVTFDKYGNCNGCQYIKKKKNFRNLQKQLNEVCNKYRSNDGSYDCIVPWSGGKDSSYVAYKLKYEYKMNPLLVTYAPLMPTKVGEKNINAFLNLGFDNEYFRVNQKVSKSLTERFFLERGDPKVHWNAGIHSIPLKVSIFRKIPLIFYAEHGESLYGGSVLKKDSDKIKDLDEIYENNVGDDPVNWATDGITLKDIQPYIMPDEKHLRKNKTIAYFFGYFEDWDINKNYEYIKSKMNFSCHPDGRSPGTFTNFDSLDDDCDQIYYYMQYIKFGFGRASRDGSRALQKNRITKEQFKNYIKSYDHEILTKDILNFCEYCNITTSKFTEIVDKHRNDEIWSKTANGWDLKNKVKDDADEN